MSALVWRRGSCVWPGLGALLCAGCPGTLDDPARFDLSGQGADRDPAAQVLDAGPRDAAWGSTDTGADSVPPRSDASSAPWPVAAGDAAWWPDAARDTSDASVGVPWRDAGNDAGLGCNFKALMQNKCGNATCHGGTGNATGLDLTSDGLAARVAGRKASDACSAYLLIDTASPAASALYLKVTDHACGVRMPLGGALANEEQQCILSWIEKL